MHLCLLCLRVLEVIQGPVDVAPIYETHLAWPGKARRFRSENVVSVRNSRSGKPQRSPDTNQRRQVARGLFRPCSYICGRFLQARRLLRYRWPLRQFNSFGEIVGFFSKRVPEELLVLFQVGAKEAAVLELEMVAISVTMRLWQQLMATKRVIVFTDNDPVKSSVKDTLRTALCAA